MVQTFQDVIDRFGGPAAFAREVGMTNGAAKQARNRASIASEWFVPVAEAAERKGLDDITVERLAELAFQRGRAA